MPGGERKKQANGGWGALNKFRALSCLRLRFESEYPAFQVSKVLLSSRGVTEGFEKKVIVLTAA